MEITEPGTIDDLGEDARQHGHTTTTRLIRDWCARGLLDTPRLRPAGRGQGSRDALYSANQRMLFLTLLHHRPTNAIASLARIPVGLWLYEGPEYVPTRQARIAFSTWLGDPRSSRQQSRHFARELTAQLDCAGVTAAARRNLITVLAAASYTGQWDLVLLHRAVSDVYEPGAGAVRKSTGHPRAPLTTDVVVALIQARTEGARRVLEGQVTFEEFETAGAAQRESLAEYILEQPGLTAGTWGRGPITYERPTYESIMNSCCSDLLTVLGLEAGLRPEGHTEMT